MMTARLIFMSDSKREAVAKPLYKITKTDLQSYLQDFNKRFRNWYGKGIKDNLSKFWENLKMNTVGANISNPVGNPFVALIQKYIDDLPTPDSALSDTQLFELCKELQKYPAWWQKKMGKEKGNLEEDPFYECFCSGYIFGKSIKAIELLSQLSALNEKNWRLLCAYYETHPRYDLVFGDLENIPPALISPFLSLLPKGEDAVVRTLLYLLPALEGIPQDSSKRFLEFLAPLPPKEVNAIVSDLYRFCNESPPYTIEQRIQELNAQAFPIAIVKEIKFQYLKYLENGFSNRNADSKNDASASPSTAGMGIFTGRVDAREDSQADTRNRTIADRSDDKKTQP
jgi:hypothetical protein